MKKLLFVVLALALVLAISCAPEEEHEHTYVEKTVDATCEEAGKSFKVCSTCGDVIDLKEIPAKGHSEDLTKVLDKEPTEETEGLYIYVCPECEKVVDKETIAKLNFGEIFVPEDVELEALSEPVLNYIISIFGSGPENRTSNVERYSYWSIKDGVFKEGSEVGTYKVEEGSGSIIYKENNETLSVSLDGKFVQALTVGVNDYNLTMSFKDAIIVSEYDSNKDDWGEPEFVDDNAFDCDVDPEGIAVSANDILAFCEEISHNKDFSDIMTSFNFESTDQEAVKDAEGKVIYKTNYLEKQTESDSKSVFSYISGNVAAGGVKHNLSMCMDGVKRYVTYIKIDDKFYNPDKLNKALAGSEE